VSLKPHKRLNKHGNTSDADSRLGMYARKYQQYNGIAPFSQGGTVVQKYRVGNRRFQIGTLSTEPRREFYLVKDPCVASPG
jgi:hypothetical protein